MLTAYGKRERGSERLKDERQPEVGDRRRVAAATNGLRDEEPERRQREVKPRANEETKRPRDEESNQGKRCECGNEGRGREAERRGVGGQRPEFSDRKTVLPNNLPTPLASVGG